MKINKLKITPLEIPLNISFKHSSAQRKKTDSVLITITSDKNNIGYGEGCPRSYVTGESINSAINFFEKQKKNIFSIKTLKHLTKYVKHNRKLIDQNPSAWCAIELALLDLLAKEENITVEKLLSLPKLKSIFQYTAVLGASKYKIFQKQFQKYKQLGFADYKIKISGNLKNDKKKLKLFKKSKFRIRLDANNLWNNYKEAISFLNKIKSKNFSYFAIEEPININQFKNLKKIAKNTNKKIILDESFLRKEQFDKIKKNHNIWIINIRVSKMGGLLRSLKIAKLAKKHSIPIIIGAQVGETSILTRAALSIANKYQNILLGQEGAFGTLLLSKDIVKKNILMFGNEGKLNINEHPCQNGKGFGLDF